MALPQSALSELLEAGTRELVAFAERLGVNSAWLQNPGTPTEHFDITEPTRQRALALGAVPLRYGRAVAALTMAKRSNPEAKPRTTG
ncbi:DUF4031 domain-containing protein [Nocardioides sp. SYSU DS0651]|uniref:DUF4031 domain-containing protein n=1 Tax=Nocardioides sp. SYSU DS0651 TaxID=3415955 RepID=UPI003F4B0FE5